MYSVDDYIYFVLLEPRRTVYAFNGYTDAAGNDCYIKDGVDKDGSDKRRRFRFGKGKRKIWIHKSKENEIEFLRKHPACEGSPNAVGKPMFKELNDEAIATTAISHAMKRKEAEDAALSLKGKELADIAILCGVGAKGEAQQTHGVLQFAGDHPEEFLSMMRSPDKEARSVFRKALRLGILSTKGFLIQWKEEYLGRKGDEDAIVEKLMKDEKLLDAIKKDLERQESKASDVKKDK